MEENIIIEDFEEPKDKVYVRTDEQSRITAIDSEWNIKDLTDWTYIDEGYGDKYHHAQGNYFDLPIINFEDSTHNYVYEDGTVRETTDEEKAKERASMPAPQSTEIEQLWDSQLEQEFRICCLELGVTTDDIK